MKKKSMKILSLLLTLVLLIGVLPGMSAYAEEYPTIWIGKTKVTILEKSGQGWSYDNSTKTLTLDGFNKTADSADDLFDTVTGFTGCIYIGDSSNVTIELKGANTLTNNINYGSGIYSQSALTFSGSGSLNARGALSGILSSSNITVNEVFSGNITATGYTGLESQNGVIEIQGGTVTANGNSAGISSPIGNGIIITGGTVTANGGTRGVGLLTALSPVKIDDGRVTASGQTGIESLSGELQINGGIVIASGSQKAIGCKVKNTIAGTGWTNTAGTEGKTTIAVSTEGQSLSAYKKVQFPAAADSFTVTYAPGSRASLNPDAIAGLTIVDGNIVRTVTESDYIIEGFESCFIAPQGETFDGWMDQNGTRHGNSEPITLTGNLTLTAQWKPASQGDGTQPQRRGGGLSGDLVFFGGSGAEDGWEYIGGGVPQRAYRLSFAPMQGGSAYFLLSTGENGETMNVYPQTTVRVVATPDSSYRLASIVWSMIDGSASYDITETQTFVMPAMDAVVYVTFQPVA